MIYENMSLEEVVEYVNEQLKSGRTMKDIEINDFGVNERTLVKRLERRKVVKINGQFVMKDGAITPLANRVGSIAPTKSNNKSTEIIIREPMKLLEDENFILLAKKVASMEKALAELMIRNTETNVDHNDFIVYSSDEKPIGKTVRLYKEIWEGLDKVRELYNHLSAQTIINSLLKESIDKYIK